MIPQTTRQIYTNRFRCSAIRLSQLFVAVMIFITYAYADSIPTTGQAIDSASSLVNYGPLGIFSLLTLGALIFIFKLYNAQHESQIAQLKEQYASLELRMTKESERVIKLDEDFKNYMSNDNKQVIAALQKYNELAEKLLSRLH